MKDELQDFIDKIVQGWSIVDPDLECEAMIDTPEGRKQMAGLLIEYRLSQSKIQREIILNIEVEKLNAKLVTLYYRWGEDVKNSGIYKSIVAEMNTKEQEIKKLKEKDVKIDAELYESLLAKEIKKLEIKSDYDKSIRMAKRHALEQVKQKVPANEIKREFYKTVNTAEVRRIEATAQMEDEELTTSTNTNNEIKKTQRKTQELS